MNMIAELKNKKKNPQHELFDNRANENEASNDF